MPAGASSIEQLRVTSPEKPFSAFVVTLVAIDEPALTVRAGVRVESAKSRGMYETPTPRRLFNSTDIPSTAMSAVASGVVPGVPVTVMTD